jgi:glyoxylase-like metal-dependent hydrolase (beta-lactamase superfamily II)
VTSDTAYSSKQIEVRRIVDLDPYTASLDILFPGATLPEFQAAAQWLSGDHFDLERKTVLLSIQSHLLRLNGKTILMDTCVGEHKQRPHLPAWHDRSHSPYLANLARCGCRPEDVDIVMCTHLHADHVGWNTRLQSGEWAPTFPNARYVISQQEMDYRAGEFAKSAQADHGSYQDSVLPILNRGLATIANGSETIDGATIIALPGHAPGQIGLEIEDGDRDTLVFIGDAIHSPLQVLYPDWSTRFCFDGAQAALTRRRLLERAVAEDLLLFPAHLRVETSMRIRDQGGRFVPAWGARQ